MPKGVEHRIGEVKPNAAIDAAILSICSGVCLRALSLKRVNPSTGRSSTLIDSFIFFGPLASHQGRLKWIALNPSQSSISLLAARGKSL